MSVPPITLDTEPLSRNINLNVDSFVAVVMSKQDVSINGKKLQYDEATVREIGQAIFKWSRIFSVDGQVVAGQILHETGYFHYGGDVRPEQYNFAGLGATGGVPGASFASVDAGVLAVFTHWSVYTRGESKYWHPSIAIYGNDQVDPRYSAVLKAGWGASVRFLKDLNGRWAYPGKTYAQQIVPIATSLAGVSQNRTIRVAIGAGHHNKSSGNAREKDWTGKLTKTYMEMGARFGHFDMRCYTPDDGMGDYRGDLYEAAREVVKWSNEGWTAHYFNENHFQGLTEGSDSGRGHFVIYPDWDTDVDEDTRDRFRPLWAQYVTTYTGMPRYGGAPPTYPGGMSEQRTGVGIDGYRLGIFRATVDLKTTTTRMLIEHGSHTSPADRKIITGSVTGSTPSQDWMERVAYSFFRTLCDLEGLNVPFEYGQQPEPPPEGEPAISEKIGEHYVEGSILQRFRDLGDLAFPECGYPITGKFRAPVGGIVRDVQGFERGWYATYPEHDTDGVPVSHPFYVRKLFLREIEEVIQYGLANGLITGDILLY